MADPGFQNIVTTLQNLVQAVNAVTATVNGALAKIWGAFGAVALTDAATVAVDMSSAINFKLLATSAVGATRALGNPSNAKPGQRGVITWTQDVVGGRAITFGSIYVAAGGVATLSPTTTANAVNVFFYTVLPSGSVLLTLAANVVH